MQQDRELAEIIKVVLADTEDVWQEVFRKNNLKYKNPTLVLFNGSVVPDSFIHGTSKQRRDWFYKGYRLGTLEGGDTFSYRSLR